MAKMTYDQLLAWGRAEAELRKDELSDIQSEAHLKQVQADVARRRRAVGLSRADATYAVMQA